MIDTYEFDNDKLIGKLIEDNWSLTNRKVKIYYDEGTNPLSHDFKSNPIAIKIYMGNSISTPQGISFDSERIFRDVTFSIRGLKREDVVLAKDELRRIMAEHRKYPCGYWDLATYLGEARVPETYNFYHYMVTYKLKKYYAVLPDITWNG